MKYLTIIVPHYNSSKLLGKLLDSIPKLPSIQTIVVDDKSDCDIERFERLKKDSKYEHVTFLKNKTNQKGAGVSRNIALSHAVGKWVLFADADDYFVPGFYDVIQSYFETDHDVIFFPPTSVELDTGNPSDRHIFYVNLIEQYRKHPCSHTENEIRYKYASPWSKMIRRSFIDLHQISFDSTIASNDVMFSTKVGHLMRSCVVTDDVIYCITRSKGTLTTNTNPSIYQARFEVFLRNYEFLRSNLEPEVFKSLQISGMAILVWAVKSGVSFGGVLKSVIVLVKHRVKIFDRRFLSLLFLFQKIRKHLVDYLYKRKFFGDFRI